MKKTLFILFAAFGIAKAQLKVISNGNVGIGVATPNAKLEIAGGSLRPYFNPYQINNTQIDDINNSLFGVSGIAENFAGDLHLRGFWGVVIDKGGGGYGESGSYSNGVNPAGGTFAIRTRTSNTSFRTDLVVRNSGNVGIGTSSPNSKLSVNGTSEFFGNSIYYGTLYVQGQHVFSDKKLKNNIVTASNALDKILQMRGVNYNAVDSMEIEQLVQVPLSTVAKSNDTSQKSSSQTKFVSKKVKIPYGAGMPNKNQYGFVAQELEKVLPNLVSTDTNGLKSVNYIAVIPLLVEAIKTQNTKIDSLKILVKQLQKGKTPASNARVDANTANNAPSTVSGTYLYQNTPNPFSQETQIRYSVPETTISAFITVTDLAGKQIKALPIVTKGESFVTLKANELYAGLFAYTLVADGNIVDTKRMVIVE